MLWGSDLEAKLVFTDSTKMAEDEAIWAIEDIGVTTPQSQ
jgi:hypothetical protein